MGGKTLESMADSLVEETLVEAATTFFGARKALEDEIELYHRRLAELERVEEEVLRRAAALHALLPDMDAVRGFYDALGVAPGHLLDAADVAEPSRAGVHAGFALTPSRRYAALVYAAYEALYAAAEVYLHGRHYDGAHGRKVQSANYNQLHGWCGCLNEKIEALNRNHSPSGTMCFVKGLDPLQLERGRLADATLDGYAAELDRELAFKPVECLAMKLLAAPELPPPDEARCTVLAYARKVYARDPDVMRELADAWKRARGGN